MTIKQNGDRRELTLEFELPGTPEQVWAAIATGPGISSWFTPCTLEPREGGSISFSFGIGVDSTGRVTSWQPPGRFAYEEPGWIDGMPPLASEFTVEARAGGHCTVRLVHSLFASDERWDDQFEGMDAGWPPFFRVLALYLREYPSQHCAPVSLAGFHAGDKASAWSTLLRLLGVNTTAQAGDAYAGTSDVPDLAGRIEHVSAAASHPHLLLNLNAPLGGAALFSVFAWEGQSRIGVNLYLYGDDAATVLDRERPRWQHWLERHFPQPSP